jgi:hypothetical protein
MSLFEEAQRKWRVGYMLRQIELSGGNISAAAQVIGIHRNTIQRELTAAGYKSRELVKISGRKKMLLRAETDRGRKQRAAEEAAFTRRAARLLAKLEPKVRATPKPYKKPVMSEAPGSIAAVLAVSRRINMAKRRLA